LYSSEQVRCYAIRRAAHVKELTSLKCFRELWWEVNSSKSETFQAHERVECSAPRINRLGEYTMSHGAPNHHRVIIGAILYFLGTCYRFQLNVVLSYKNYLGEALKTAKNLKSATPLHVLRIIMSRDEVWTRFA